MLFSQVKLEKKYIPEAWILKESKGRSECLKSVLSTINKVFVKIKSV